MFEQLKQVQVWCMHLRSKHLGGEGRKSGVQSQAEPSTLYLKEKKETN